jgi:glycine hydroxymethyltransferase
LAITLLDWLDVGCDYARAMVDNAVALASGLHDLEVPIFTTASGHTQSHQLVVDATQWGGGAEAATALRRSNLLTSAIGLPGDETAGLRFGTPEITRIGMTTADMPELADLIATGLRDPDSVAERASAMRQRFDTIQFVST